MAEAQAVPQADGSQPQCQPKVDDFDFDIGRTFTLLIVTLVLPVYLAISVVSYSLAAIY